MQYGKSIYYFHLRAIYGETFPNVQVSQECHVWIIKYSLNKAGYYLQLYAYYYTHVHSGQPLY